MNIPAVHPLVELKILRWHADYIVYFKASFKTCPTLCLPIFNSRERNHDISFSCTVKNSTNIYKTSLLFCISWLLKTNCWSYQIKMQTVKLLCVMILSWCALQNLLSLSTITTVEELRIGNTDSSVVVSSTEKVSKLSTTSSSTIKISTHCRDVPGGNKSDMFTRSKSLSTE